VGLGALAQRRRLRGRVQRPPAKKQQAGLGRGVARSP
jgi:hypothetical protein